MYGDISKDKIDSQARTGGINSVRDPSEIKNLRKKLNWKQPGSKIESKTESMSQSPSSYINKSVDYLK